MVTVSWEQLSCTVKDKKTKKPKVILQPTVGEVKGGEVLAIMGPSGSGKTTLLNILAGRTSKDKLGGLVKFGGEVLSWKEQKKIMSYVAQEDSLMGVFSVRETLWYAAAFHYGFKIPDGVIEDCLEVMGLTNVEHTVVGDIFRKGISGGQKRRLSIAIELISKPQALFLDEPTSGLDSASALAIISHLSHLAETHGTAIITTIHQPSSQVWNEFNKFMLMSRGNTLYFGPAKRVLMYFEEVGYKCPQFSNPADFLLDLVNTDFGDDHQEILDKLIVSYKQRNPDDTSMSMVVNGGVSHEVDHMEAGVLTKEIESTHVPGISGIQAFVEHFLILSHRNLWNNVRNPGIYWVRFVMYVMLSLVIGLMYLHLGDQYNAQSVQSRISALFFVAAFLVFMSVAVLPFFIQERAVFLRERVNGAYNTLPYVISNFFCMLPGLLLIAVFSTICVILPTGMNGFGYYLAILFIALITAESFMSLISSLVPHFIVGIAVAAGVFGFFMLCEGFFIVKSQIPGWFIWGYYIAFHTYTFRAFMYNEFSANQTFQNPQFPTGASVLAYYDMTDVVIWQQLLIVLAFGVLFQILFGLVLYFFHRGKVL